MSEIKCDYLAEITAEITKNAITFQENAMGEALKTWGYRKEDIEKALLELDQYRKLGTVEKFQNLIERDTPEEIITETSNKDIDIGDIVFKKGFQVYHCPCCGFRMTALERYCMVCGQKLSWDSIDDGKTGQVVSDMDNQ